jgi:hypothetical protein
MALASVATKGLGHFGPLGVSGALSIQKQPDVGLAGKTGSDRCIVKPTRLTQSGSRNGFIQN